MPAPPVAPTLDSATYQSTSGNIVVSWTPNGSGDGTISSYNIYRGTSSGGEGSSSYHTVNAPATQYSDSNISPGTTYYYKVTAVSQYGESTKSNEKSAYDPPTVPGSPTGLSAGNGPNRIDLSWTAPSSDGGAAIQGYKVYRSTTSGGESLYTTLNSTSTSWSDTGTTNGVTYYYKVAAFNSAGTGGKSNEDYAHSYAPANPPGTVTGLTVTGNGQNIDLSWTAPSNGGSAITNYKVYRSTSSGGESFYTNTGSSSTSWTDTGVYGAVTYYYKVAAQNSVGTGGQSSEASGQTASPTPPSPPLSVGANASDGSVALSWSAPTYNGGASITDYDIYRSTTSGSETLLGNVGSATTSYTDNSVTNDTKYYYKVAAVNSVGTGGQSSEVSATPQAFKGIRCYEHINTPTYGVVEVPVYGTSAVAPKSYLRFADSSGNVGAVPTLSAARAARAWDFWRFRDATGTRYVQVGDGLIPTHTANWYDDLVTGSSTVFTRYNTGDGPSSNYDSTMPKFGVAADMTGTLNMGKDYINTTGEWAMVLIVGNISGTTALWCNRNNLGSTAGVLDWQNTTLTYNDTAGNQKTSPTFTDPGNTSTVQFIFHFDSASPRNATIQVYQGTTQLVNWTFSRSPPSQSNATFTFLGGNTPGNTSIGRFYEARFWQGSTTPAVSTLQQIIDPTDPTYYRKLEGNELAAIFGEGYSP